MEDNMETRCEFAAVFDPDDFLDYATRDYPDVVGECVAYNKDIYLDSPTFLDDFLNYAAEAHPDVIDGYVTHNKDLYREWLDRQRKRGDA